MQLEQAHHIYCIFEKIKTKSIIAKATGNFYFKAYLFPSGLNYLILLKPEYEQEIWFEIKGYLHQANNHRISDQMIDRAYFVCETTYIDLCDDNLKFLLNKRQNNIAA